MQLELFEKNFDYSEILEAYISCRKNKRNSINALKFEIDYEIKLMQLLEEINTDTYIPDRSIAFIVNKPVKREIFASNFRDRIVHHLVINKINKDLDKTFIHDSYACRKEKGVLFGVKRINKFIRRCSKNYSQDCYILKLDIKGFFMHIDKIILFKKLEEFFKQNYTGINSKKLLELSREIIFNNPVENCKRKGLKSDWEGLPKDKSLFYSSKNCGLPIGNLTSQIFANLYFNSFDHYVKKKLGIKYYGRYVDDFVLVHKDFKYLKSLIDVLRKFLKQNLNLEIHPKKIYLQHYTKGVLYLGAMIKPNRIYLRNRTKGNIYASIKKYDSVIHDINEDMVDDFLSTMNSYLGLIRHYNSFNLRKIIFRKNLSNWNKYVFLNSERFKFIKVKNCFFK